MPSYRCSDCDANWIDMVAFRHCPGCGKATSYTQTSPTRDLTQAEAARTERIRKAGTQPPKTPDQPTEELELPKDELHEHRVERFLSLGFTAVDSELLACARDGVGFPLYWGHIAKWLASGCTHAQAVAIYA